MKRLINYIALSLAIIASSSCTKLDNYKAPDQTVQGIVTDLNGQGIQSESGVTTRIKLLETSYSDNPTPQYLAVHQDGTYIDTKLFAATYKVTAEGPFVPMVQTSPAVDQSQTVVVKGGSTTINFKVEPLLKVEWVSGPTVNADKTITAQVKISRGTANPLFQNNITDVTLFINTSQYVGNNIYDTGHFGRLSYTGNAANAVLGTTLTLTTGGGALPVKDYFVRIGARTDYGLKQYNYTDVRMVTVQ